MNRKERRKQGKKEQVKTYTMTEAELQKYREKAKTDAVSETFIFQVFVGVMVLRDKGWGQKRLAEFVKGCVDLMDSVSKGYLDYLDMITTIKEETGIDIKEYL